MLFDLLKLILNFSCGEPKLPLTPKVALSPNIKKIFLQLWEWGDELLSTPKIIKFLGKPLTELCEPTLPIC